MTDEFGTGSNRASFGGMPISARRLAALANLTVDDFKVLGALKGRTIKAGTLIQCDVAASQSPSLIMSGWCARVDTGQEGLRQITGILLPGDGYNLGCTPWAGDQMSVMTLTSAVIVDASPVRNLIRLRAPAHARLIDACHQLAWLEQNYSLNHIIRLAGRDGYARVAHFIVEIYDRLDEIGYVQGGTFTTPIAQPIVAEILGLSGVHLNRITRQLRKEGLVDFPRGVVHVLDRERLARVSGFQTRAPIAGR